MSRAAAALLLALLAGEPAAASPPIQAVAVQGNAFRITLADGRVLAQDELPGTVLALGDGSGRQRRLRIDSIERDPRDPAGEVMLYGLAREDPATGSWSNLCQPDPDGRRLGFPLAGAFTPDGRYLPEPARLLITCTGGAEGKCVRFGYKPWGTTADGTPLEPYYQACVRLVRADYGGDGAGHTRNGTPIDIFDHIGIQRDEPGAGMTLEAAFAPEGAVCVRHTRLPDVLDMATLAARYPQLAGHLGPTCDEAVPALLYVRSVEH